MAASKEKELKLVISAYTKGVEAGMAKVQADLKKLKQSTNSWGRDLTIASNALDVRPTKLVTAEVSKLRAEYARLKNSGKLSQAELAQAAANLKTKIAAARGQQSQLNKAMAAGQEPTSRLTGSVKNMIGAYLGYRAITGIYSAITNGAKDAEQAQFNLEASVSAASREFENTGGLDQWQEKIKTLSADLRIYSETDVANAAARTVDMTKRLGLSSEQMEVLISRTADLSAGKTTLEGGIERVTAALRGEAEASEYLGLTLNETYIKSWYEANNATGKAWKNLTDVEKAQIRYNVLLEQSEALQGRAANSATTYNGALELVKAQLSNAIANNEELGNALSRVAHLLADNADGIANVAAAIATGIGDLVQFVIENKNLIATLIGSGGLVMLLSKTAGAINNIGTAVSTVGAIETPEILGKGGGINAALLVRFGLYGAIAAEVIAMVASYNSMREAQDEAAAAADRLALSQATAQGIADAAADSTGLQIKTIQELNQLLRDGKVVIDEVTGQYLTATQATDNHTAAVQRQIDLDDQRNESFAGVAQLANDLTAKYGDLSSEALNASYKQELLDDALKNSKTTLEYAKASTAKLADTYYDAASALAYLEEGEAGYEAALARKLAAETAYVKSVNQLKAQQLQATRQALNNEETDLENSLDARLIALDGELQNEFITKKEYDNRKAEAEQEVAEQILAIRQRMYDAAAQQYGADSQKAIEARHAVVEAENDVASAILSTQKATSNLTGNITTMGNVGVSQTNRACRAMAEYKKKIDDTSAAMKQLATGFNAGLDRQSDDIANITTMGEYQMFKKKMDKEYQFADLGTFSSFFKDRYEEQMRDKINELLSAQTHKLSDKEKLQEQYYTEISNSSRAGYDSRSWRNAAAKTTDKMTAMLIDQQQKTQPTKQMTINLQAANGQTVTGNFAENDAGALLDILRQAGMVTA